MCQAEGVGLLSTEQTDCGAPTSRTDGPPGHMGTGEITEELDSPLSPWAVAMMGSQLLGKPCPFLGGA